MSEYGVKVGVYIFSNLSWNDGYDYHLQVNRVTKKMCYILDRLYDKEEKKRITRSEVAGTYITIASTHKYGFGSAELIFEKAKYLTQEQYEDQYHVEDEYIISCSK